MGPDAMILVFWMLSFKLAFSFFSFTFIKRLFSSSSLSAIRVVSSLYLGLLIFLPAILIPACASSSPAVHMMYSAYKLNEQGDNIQPWRTPFPILNQSVVPWPVLTVASRPAYRFLRRQVSWSDIPISLRIFHSLLWPTWLKASVNFTAFGLFIGLHNRQPQSIFKHFVIPRRNPGPLHSHTTRKPLADFLFLKMCLFWTFPRYLRFKDW